jgi:hypothetical protein
MATSRVKLGAASALILLICAVIFILLAPEHLLRRVNAVVTVGGRPVYFVACPGNPTLSEADGYLLVKIAGEGNCFFNFDNGTFREVSGYEFVPLHWDEVVIKPMSVGPWRAPLPDQNLNEFRFAARNGHIVKVMLGQSNARLSPNSM